MDKRLRNVLIVAGIAGVLLFARALLFGPSDRQLIDAAVKESVLASREGRPGGVLEYLSNSFTLNSESGLDRKEISRFIKSGKPEVVIRNPEPVISGETAEIVTPVHVKFDYLAFKYDQEIPKVVIQLQKESATKWLVIPTKTWKIVSVTAPDIATTDFVPQ